MINIDILRGDSKTFTLTINDNANQPVDLSQYDGIFMDLSASPVVPTQTVKLSLGSGLSIAGNVLTIQLTEEQTSILRANKYYSDLKFVGSGGITTFAKIEFSVSGTATKIPSDSISPVVIVDKWVYKIDTVMVGNSETSYNVLNSGEFVVYGLTSNLNNQVANLQYIEISSVSNNGTSYVQYFGEHAVATAIGVSTPYAGTLQIIDTVGNSLLYNVVGQYFSSEDRIQLDINYVMGNGDIAPNDEVQIIFNLVTI